jgi:hypothetical protein
MDFPYSIHSQAGVNCVDCHLRHFGAPGDRAIHTMPDHSFTANLESCAACHQDQMHNSAAGPNRAQVALLDQVPANGNGQVSDKPTPVSPLGYAGLAGLFGLAGGIILAPWLGKAYRLINKKGG